VTLRSSDLLETRDHNVEVDTMSDLCRGRTVVNLWRRSGREPNAHVAVGIDSDAFIALLLERLAALG
jgi:inosine-uridine nucleoside N-ribohydrolase